MAGDVRAYNPSVRVGNWNEDIVLEEDTLKDFLEKRERGELLSQKSSNLKKKFLQKVDLSVSRDGKVHFEDVVMLVNPQHCDQLSGACKEGMLTINMSPLALYNANELDEQCDVSISHDVQPQFRSSFVIRSFDGSPPGEVLRYGQPFYLKTYCGELYLKSDHPFFKESAKKSRNNKVQLVPEISHATEWKIIAFDPEFRVELEWAQVPCNEKVIMVHVKTNQSLCVEADTTLRTPYGWDKEVSASTKFDSHKMERDCNHFIITMQRPGSDHFPVVPPTIDNYLDPCQP